MQFRKVSKAFKCDIHIVRNVGNDGLTVFAIVGIVDIIGGEIA